MFAIKDIKKGAQIFYDYNKGNLGEYSTANFKT